ncbi:hypothetical protein Acor_40830 [Acrocarpospora corrugata]|uniref:Uncharacterized protein n=1 Tax=Acrocarpospora corrugata TaxID=35763 RepID=A0A5M3W638_9ACTN|nr:hypothetical protein Acor_40830 [Acrocarpospora corrugata]
MPIPGGGATHLHFLGRRQLAELASTIIKACDREAALAALLKAAGLAGKAHPSQLRFPEDGYRLTNHVKHKRVPDYDATGSPGDTGQQKGGAATGRR